MDLAAEAEVAAHAVSTPVAAPINRELSLLDFHRRVLALAEDAEVPLLERLRFLCIVGSNLDEFFEIRVAGVKEQLRAKVAPPGITLPEARELVGRMGDEARALIAQQYRVLNEQVLPALAASGVRLVRRTEFTRAERAWAAEYFAEEVRPLLTPIGLDPAHPFPQVVNKSLNFVIELSGNDAFGRDTGIAIVKAPRVLPRIIRLPREISGDDNAFVMLSSVIHAHLAELFPGRKVVGYSQFRVTRDADLWIDEEEVKNLRQALQGELPQRQFGSAVRLEVAAECPEALAHFLLQQFGLAEADLYRCDGPVNIARLSSLADQVDVDALKYEPFVAGIPARLRDAPDILAAIREHDILLHHPYQSFEPVVEFIRCAAEDADVVAIKQTVYRTGVNSVLMEALIEAARGGKEVTVVVELMARFDEEANINWAERLERAGAQVVYGVFGLKTHAKLALLIRRERDARGRARLVPYAHLGTGNYHPRTARLYTDFDLLTANEAIGADVNEVFQQLTGLGKVSKLKHVWQSPFTLHKGVLDAIENETRIARSGKPARIIAKMNALLEPQVIEALYAASQAGVKIDLVVRGVCALRPGVPKVSDNIRVISVIGRFLEHPRIFYFRNGGEERVWLSSADWMDRNFFRRIELCFPVNEAKLRRRVVAEGLRAYLDDNTQAWEMQPDGAYLRRKRGRSAGRCAQRELLKLLGASD